MIFNSIPWFLVAGFFMCCGCAVAAIVLDRRYRDDRKKTEAGMTERLEERLEAYEELEVQVKTVVESFSQHEQTFKELFTVQKEHIEQLKAALSAHVGEPAPAEAASTEETLAWMDDADEDAIEVVTDDGGAQTVAELQRKLDGGRAEQEEVLERERRSLSETRMRIASLQPLQESLRNVEAELVDARAEVDGWKQKCSELEQRAAPASAPTAEANGSVEPLIEDLARVKAVVSEWQAKARELAEAKTAEVAALSERLSSLDPLLHQATESRRDAEKWRGEYTELEKRAAEAASAHYDEVQHLRGEIADFEGRFAKACADLEALVAANNGLTERADELGRNLDCVQLELDKAHSAQRTTEAQGLALASQLAELDSRAQTQSIELDALRARCRELGTESDERAATIVGLEARARELATTLTEKSRLLAGSETLARELDVKKTELSGELEALRSEHQQALSASEERVASLTQELTGAIDECRALKASVAHWTERSVGRERELELKRGELADREQRLSEVSARVEALDLEVARERETLLARDRSLQESATKLERADAEIQKYRDSLSAHAHQFEIAQSLLAELKPVIENLESELTNEKVAGS
ncbi:MAG: hypothetical protein HZA52_13810 [Planctomycetes bacterium]|nr:hypothetical protein [Planctomycetota bacterium]